MVILTREQRRQDFDDIMSILEVASEDNAHELFMELTQKGKRNIITMLNMDRSGLKDLKATGTNRNKLAFDDWEVSEIISICRYAARM